MCLYPTLIRNPKYLANAKNGGNPPPITDPRTQWVPIGCQDCIECRKKKAREWQTRLAEDITKHTNGKFITLTFNQTSLQKLYNHEKIKDLKGYHKDNAVATLATRLFLERARKKYKRSIRHWLVSELGTKQTERIHLHGILFTDKPLTEIEQIWQYGHVWKGKLIKNKIVNYVSQKTVNYITKYITKQDEKHPYYKAIVLTSPGIGNAYTTKFNATRNQFKDRNTDTTYRTTSGHRISLPIYWRNKIYTDQQREKLWLNQLDNQIRYILGTPIDIRKGYNTYYRVLKCAQKQNNKLGYGNGEKTWDQLQYEIARREMLRTQPRTPSCNLVLAGQAEILGPD